MKKSGKQEPMTKNNQMSKSHGFGMKLGSSDVMRKYAEDAMKKHGSDTSRTPLNFVDTAIFDPTIFFIQHKNRKELNFRYRHYYKWHPLVHNIIGLHSSFPLSDFEVSCQGEDQSIEREYEEVKDRLDLLNLFYYVLKDYFMLGEAIVHGRWDDAENTFRDFVLLRPEDVIMKSVYVIPEPIMFLEVNEDLKKVVNSANEIDKEITRQMDPNMVKLIKEGKMLPLKSEHTGHFFDKTSGYDVRGTSLIQPILKDLMYEDKLRILQTTFVDRHNAPIKIFKLGDQTRGWIPGKRYFEEFRDLLASAANDPDFSIIWNYGIDVDYVGTKDKIANLIPEFEFVENRILTGLFANKSLTHGEGLTYSNSNVSVRILMHRYMIIRDMLANFARRKIFTPIAQARGYYKNDSTGQDRSSVNINGKYRSLILPKIKWKKLNLIDDTQQKQFLMQLRDKAQVSSKVIMEMFDLDPEDMKKQLIEEEGTVVDPVYVDARNNTATDFAGDILAGKKGFEISQLVKDKKLADEKASEIPDESLPMDMGAEPIPTEERSVPEVTPEPEEEAGF